jgi:aryl-alcohol dehydrogenase-like predicted oxidoreductase
MNTTKNFRKRNTNEKPPYNRLGKSGLKISRIVLGTMGYGDPKWQGWVLPESESLPLLEYAYQRGIRTWDTADIYSNGRSEEIIGKAIKQYDIPREDLVILSKCYFGAETTMEQMGAITAWAASSGKFGMSEFTGAPPRSSGLSRKSIFASVEASVKRLGTYIDVLQIHRMDRGVEREEIMKALNDVIERGWVRYIGASSMQAWEFQALQNVAEKNGWHKFISMQNYYNLLYREEEREMIPYCKDAGVGLIPVSFFVYFLLLALR